MSRSSNACLTERPRPRPVPVAVAVMCLAALWLCGCSGETESRTDAAGLAGVYVMVEGCDPAMRLELGDDGTFSYREGPCEDEGMRPLKPPVAQGTWTFDADTDTLELSSEAWSARFVAGFTRVEAPQGADALRSLRWVTSTEGSPFSACDLVARDEFHELLHPTEGSGSSQF